MFISKNMDKNKLIRSLFICHEKYFYLRFLRIRIAVSEKTRHKNENCEPRGSGDALQCVISLTFKFLSKKFRELMDFL